MQVSGYKISNSTPNVEMINCSGRLSGGLYFLYKEKYYRAVTMLFIWCKLDKSCLGTTQDIYLCGAYIPPLNSTYFLPDIFEELEKDISFFNSQGSILYSEI